MIREIHITTQRGTATLIIGLILLVLLTGVSLFTARVGIDEQKNSANQRRYVDSFERAEQGLEKGFAFITKNRRYMNSTGNNGWFNINNTLWTECTSGATALPCGNGTLNRFGSGWVHRDFAPSSGSSGPAKAGEYNVYLLAQCANNPCNRVLLEPVAGEGDFIAYVIGQGFSDTPNDPFRSQAVVMHQTTTYSRANRGPDVPLIAEGAVNLSGNITAVPNPNAGGPGVPLSVWSEHDVDTIHSSPQTCQLGDYLQNGSPTPYSYTVNGNSMTIQLCTNCGCPNPNNPAQGELLTQANTEGIDVLDVDGGLGANPDSSYFPPDLLAYVFGVPRVNWIELYSQAEVVSSCSNLNSNSAGLYWVTGGCAIAANTQVGSPEAPVAIVVDEGDLRINGGATVFGVVFSFDNPDKSGTGGDVQINGGPIVYGSIIIDHSVDLSNGAFTVRYDDNVLSTLNLDVNKSLARVAGGWMDFY